MKLRWGSRLASRRWNCAAGSVLESGAELCSGERAGVSCRDPASETKVSAGNGRARDLTSDSREGQRKMVRQMQRQEKAREDIIWQGETFLMVPTSNRIRPGRHQLAVGRRFSPG